MRRLRSDVPANRRLGEEEAVCRSCGGKIADRALVAYGSMPGECCIDRLIEACWRGRKTVILPRVVEGGVLSWHRVENWDACRSGSYGIREPAPESCRLTAIPAGSFVCVPGLAFDRVGRRLGMGGGFYDRALTPMRHRGCLLVGIAYRCQLIDAVPEEDHDQRMDAVCAGGEWFDCSLPSGP